MNYIFLFTTGVGIVFGILYFIQKRRAENLLDNLERSVELTSQYREKVDHLKEQLINAVEALNRQAELAKKKQEVIKEGETIKAAIDTDSILDILRNNGPGDGKD